MPGLVLAILAILLPWVVDAGVAVHVALEAHHGHEGEHHEDDEDLPAQPAGVHGHPHDDRTPAHDHGSSLPEAASRTAPALNAIWSAPSSGALPPLSHASWALGDAVAVEPSPPTVSTSILRI